MTDHSSSLYKLDQAVENQQQHRSDIIRHIASRFDAHDQYYQPGTNPNVNVRPGIVTKIYAYRIIEQCDIDNGVKIKQHLCLTDQGFIKPPQLLID